MASTKTYTVKENLHHSHSRQHRLIRAAYEKGLTNVTIAWYSVKSTGPHCGWYIMCDQLDHKHIGYDMGEAETRINKIDKR